MGFVTFRVPRHSAYRTPFTFDKNNVLEVSIPDALTVFVDGKKIKILRLDFPFMLSRSSPR